MAAFGMHSGMEHMAHTETFSTTLLALDALTVGTGAYVLNASLLTYEGGIYATKGFEGTEEPEGWVDDLVHPKKGALAITFEKTLDRPIQWINANVGKPAIFWVSEEIKAAEPFTTSMWARVPWRVATGGVALALGAAGQILGANVPAGQFEFAVANAGWATGDVAVGSFDWKPETQGIPDNTAEPS